MHHLHRYISSLLVLVFFTACAPHLTREKYYDEESLSKDARKAYQRVDQFLTKAIVRQDPLKISPYSKIDTIIIDKTQKQLQVFLTSNFAEIPFREDNTARIYTVLKKKLGRKFRKYDLMIYSLDQPIEQLIPNMYRKSRLDFDTKRLPAAKETAVPILTNSSKPWLSQSGLYNRHIALWPSHGWYFENRLNRWEWQRARVFQTVEDLLPMSFIVPYLAPMLENAGAAVFMPRERDIQINEVVVDNDSPDDSLSYAEIANGPLQWETGPGTGFAAGSPPYNSGDNPFKQGSFRRIISSRDSSAAVSWQANIPETGLYAVYISYAHSDSCVSDARYTVFHSGGQTMFKVNQQMGGSTWLYLGTFHFEKGCRPDQAKVTLSNQSAENGRWITADAVRFGGGMGNVARRGQLSGRPRFSEGARYYLQYAGCPDTLVYSFHGDSIDYKDDYQSRGEWVNYLKGAPFGPNKNRRAPGLDIPVDLSLGFHTDAGSTPNDSTIGTLMIYSSYGTDTSRVFPDSVSRFASRDFADILQTTLVDDIRQKYDRKWTRRAIWDKRYSEACRPNVPAALLELSSHHNFQDMKFALDPRFRFDTSRSIYKAMLKFLASQHSFDYVVQPLPVSHFCAEFDSSGVVLKWRPVEDPFEPTARPGKFIVYQRIGTGGFDNGTLVEQPFARIENILADSIYSFKVSAVNRGGESFPSEVLSVCRAGSNQKPVLIVNGFDRLSGPATFESGSLAGFAGYLDQGVPDHYDFSYTGSQYDFDRNSAWLDDDAPGHGASGANFETRVIAGNTFDYPFIHGRAIKTAGYSFVSCSDEALADSLVDPLKYKTIDLILGEEKQTGWPGPNGTPEFKAFPRKLQRVLAAFCRGGGNVFVSGSYVGTDLYENGPDSLAISFAAEILKYRQRTNYAVTGGALHAVDSGPFSDLPPFRFNTRLNPHIYAAEAPDAIEAAGSAARTILRYSENNTSAAIASKGYYKTVVFGFPFETIIGPDQRARIMGTILYFFEGK